MLLKLTTVLLVLARLAPETIALPVNSTAMGDYERFECISDTSFWNGAEMKCPQGTHCEDVEEVDGSPCVNDLPAGACPPLDEEGDDDDDEEEPVESGTSILPVPGPSASGAEPSASAGQPSAGPLGPSTSTVESSASAVETSASATEPSASASEPSASLQILNAWAHHDRPGAHSVRPDAQPAETQQPAAAAVIVTTPVVAPVVTPVVPPVETPVVPPAPVQTTEQPVAPSVQPTAAVVPPAPAAGGDIFGTTEFTAGSATFQVPPVLDATGACGVPVGDPTVYHVALAQAKWDSYGGDPSNGNSSPLCIQKKTVTVTYKDKVIPNVPVLDKCMGCTGDDLDMSRQLFVDLFQSLGGDPTGYGRIPGKKSELGHATWRFDP